MAILKGSDYSRVFMLLLHYKANVLLLLGRKQEGEEAYKRCIFYSYAMGENVPTDSTFELEKKYFEDDFGYKLELSLPW